MNYQKLINSNIKKLRNKYQLTQEEFAEKIGVSIQGLSNLERNRYQPTSETIDKICKAFNIEPVELLLVDVKINEDMINNIVNLISNCSKKKLKQIYNIILLLI
ncbi:MAG: helix-turn-helix transcriptional regulator [Candidatus Gastranaerophilales bacterium]